ncbi:MAG: MFS transporter [Gammaproteobacteria bacterium]
MRNVLAATASLLTSVGLLMLAGGLFGSLISLRSVAEGFPKILAGSMMSAFYVGMILGTLRCGRLINRVGHIRAFGAFCAITAATILAYPFYVNPWYWLVLRMIIGFNMAGLYMVAESWLNAKAQHANRATLLSLYMMTSYIAMGGGQFLLNLGPVTGTELFMIAAMLFSVALVPVAVTRASHPSPVEAPHFGFRRLYRISPLAVIGCMLAGMIAGAVWGMAPIFGKELGLSTAEISVFMGILIASGLLFQLPVGRLSDHIDRRIVIAGVALACVVASLAMLPITRAYSFATLDPTHEVLALPVPVWIFLAAALFGGFTATLYPLNVAHANDHIDPSELVPASGGLILAYGTGAISGPLGAASVMHLMGPAGLFVFNACAALLLALVAFWRIRQGTPIPEEDKEEFVAMPEVSTTPVATEVDPRLSHPTDSENELQP